MNIKQRIIGRISKIRIGKRLLEEQRYRTVASAALSFSVNLLYALYHGVLGIMTASIWFITMCAYYIILSTMRFSAVLCERKNGAAPALETEYFVMKLAGGLLALLSLVLAGAIYISLSQNIATKYSAIVMITIAAYTFYKITMAVIRAVKQRTDPSPLLRVIRSIGYADVAASVLTLQRSMYASFPAAQDSEAFVMNTITGAAVCTFILALGVVLAVRGVKKKEKQICQNPSL